MIFPVIRKNVSDLLGNQCISRRGASVALPHHLWNAFYYQDRYSLGSSYIT